MLFETPDLFLGGRFTSKLSHFCEPISLFILYLSLELGFLLEKTTAFQLGEYCSLYTLGGKFEIFLVVTGGNGVPIKI